MTSRVRNPRAPASRVRVEGTGRTAPLARYLTTDQFAGGRSEPPEPVQLRRQRGSKTDSVDAEAATRAAASGQATAVGSQIWSRTWLSA